MIESQTFRAFIKKHNYLVFSFLALGLVSILLLMPKSAELTLKVTLVICVGFLGWSIAHHYHDKTLTLEIMAEYILTIALVLVSVVYFFL